MKNSELSIITIKKIIDELEKINANPMHANQLDHSQILTDQDLCKLLKISKRTLHRYCKNGMLPYFKIGKSYLYLKNDVYYKIIEVQNSYK